MNRHLETGLRVGLPLVTLALFFGLWSYYVRDATISPFILPAPEKIGNAFLLQIVDPDVWRHVRVTLTEALGGFCSALVAGVTLGALMAKLPPIEWAFKPFIIALQLIPKVALAPLFILWFGFGLESKIVISGYWRFFRSLQIRWPPSNRRMRATAKSLRRCAPRRCSPSPCSNCRRRCR